MKARVVGITTDWGMLKAEELRADGINGALVIRRCDDPNRKLYDHDKPSHTLIVADWNHFPSDVFFPGYFKNVSHIPIKPDGYLINGLGSYSVRNSIGRCHST